MGCVFGGKPTIVINIIARPTTEIVLSLLVLRVYELFPLISFLAFIVPAPEITLICLALSEQIIFNIDYVTFLELAAME